MSVSAKEWEDVMTLLAMVILADRRVRDEEIQTFTDAIINLSDQYRPDWPFQTAMAEAWFKTNRVKIAQRISGPDGVENMWEAIQRVDGFAGREDLLASMLYIARSDNEFHRQEANLIRRACLLWGIEMDNLTPDN